MCFKLYRMSNLDPSTSSTLHCNECDFSTGKEKKLGKHMRKCHAGHVIRCLWCVGGHYSSSPETLRVHKKQQHGSVRLGCFLCHFSTRNLSRWADHLSRVHSRGVASSLVCVASSVLCCKSGSKSVTSESQVRNGQNLTSGDGEEDNRLSGRGKRPSDVDKDTHFSHKCSLCSFTTKHPRNLRRHLRVHSQERPYKCQYCDYAAKRKTNLCTHLRTHTNEKPYKCPVCDFRTTAKGTLGRHLRIHTNERPYKCPCCKYAANAKHNLTRHIRRIHISQCQ